MQRTFFLVPGAWHPQATFDLLTTELESLGHATEAVKLKSVGSKASQADDASQLKEQLLSLLADGKKLIVVLHSYAGFPGSTAVHAVINRDRSQYPGEILGLVFMAAFVPHQGVSLTEMAGGERPAWQNVDEAEGKIEVLDAVTPFYADVDASLAAKATKSLQYQSLQAFDDQCGPIGYTDPSFDGRRAYILCEHDAAIPSFAQRAMLEQSGVKWDIKVFNTSHSPFLSDPKGLADYLDSLASTW